MDVRSVHVIRCHESVPPIPALQLPEQLGVKEFENAKVSLLGQILSNLAKILKCETSVKHAVQKPYHVSKARVVQLAS